MASTSKKASMLPGRSALAGKPATRHANPDACKPGDSQPCLVLVEIVHHG